MKAILTADIVNSSALSKKEFEKLIASLKLFFEVDNSDFFNGDSFRVLLTDPAAALLKCIKSRLIAIGYSNNQRIDIRVSINIGTLPDGKIDLRSSMEELLVASGRSFARLQETSKHIFIASPDAEKNFTYEIIADYTDSLLEQVTAKQARVLFEMLEGRTQVQTAALLKLSTATISKQIKAARYNEIKSMLSKFKILTAQL